MVLRGTSERSLLSGAALAVVLASLITLAMAWPVVRHPTTTILGQEIVGRHADPYATIFEIGHASTTNVRLQPLSDGAGWLLARVMPPVAAYNLLTLLAFPLAALTAYLLARYLTRSHAASLIAGLAFAFSPIHVAQAAYHPQIAQVQWWPLYVLALVAMVDRLSLPRLVGGALGCAAITLAATDAGIIALLMAPVIVAVFWAIRDDADRNPWPFLTPIMVVAAVAAVSLALLYSARPTLFSADAGLGYQLNDVPFFRARLWAYFTPPYGHVLLSSIADSVVGRSDVTLQLTEMQIYFGYALLLLAAAALPISVLAWRREPRWRFVPALLAAAIVATLLSISPPSGECLPTSLAPGCVLFGVVPLLRVYARFAILAQLLLAVAAGFAAVVIARRSSRGRWVTTVLLTVLAVEYWPFPAGAHDVLPSTAHRWLAESPDEGRVLDCYPFSPSEGSVSWLTGRDITFLGEQDLASCNDPKLGERLAGLGVQQMLVRRNRVASQPMTPLPQGITLARAFDDADLYDVSQSPPVITVVRSPGFLGPEHAGDDWWQWMGMSASWELRNTTTEAKRIALLVHLQPFAAPRTLTYRMDGGEEHKLPVPIDGQEFTLGPWTLAPGAHELRFSSDGEALRPSDLADTDDRRVLAISFRNERWVEMP